MSRYLLSSLKIQCFLASLHSLTSILCQFFAYSVCELCAINQTISFHFQSITKLEFQARVSNILSLESK